MKTKLSILLAALGLLAFLTTDAADAHNRRTRARRATVQAAAAVQERVTVVKETPMLEPANFNGEGTGMYVDMSTAQQLSTFTINKRMVSCGVGTFAMRELGTTGPFAMMMYSTKIDSYDVDVATKSIRAAGTMRSITKMGGLAILPNNSPAAEDVEHQFVATASDRSEGGNQSNDVYMLHFKTPFWNTGNPMCSPSTVVSGGCKFGTAVGLSMGDVVVR